MVFGNPQSYITRLLLHRLHAVLRENTWANGHLHLAQLVLDTPRKRCERRFRGEVALSLAYPHHIDVSQFEYAVNYHNSSLPKYAGVFSTAWAIYQGEERTGYTWHRMTNEFDAGNTLAMGEMPVNFVPSGWFSMARYEMRKTQMAATSLGHVLYCIASRAKGAPQTGVRSYYGLRDYRRVTGETNVSPEEAARIAAVFGKSAGPHRRGLTERLLGRVLP